MRAYLKRVHLIVGLIALVIFPLTGAYMRFYLADARIHRIQERGRTE